MMGKALATNRLVEGRKMASPAGVSASDPTIVIISGDSDLRRELVIKVSQYLLVMLWLRLTCTTVLQNWLLAITCDQDFKFLRLCVNAVL